MIGIPARSDLYRSKQSLDRMNRLLYTGVQMTNQETEHWVTLRDVATHVGVTTDTLYRWIEQRGLPGVRAGRHWRFKLTEVDAWLSNGGARAAQQERAEAKSR